MHSLRYKRLSQSLRYALYGAITFAGFSSVVNAAEYEEETKITVLGSHIKRASAEGPSPIEVYDREDIENSGYQNLHQFFERNQLAGAGTFSTRGNSQDSTANGAAAISLRGFGSDATLVLINGRRVSISSFAEGITSSFVDINSIPMSAIERIDILKDGASAIYGSDAVAGVINITLRSDFIGSEVSVGYGNTFDTDADERTLNGVFGFGDDSSSATFIFDYFSNSAMTNADRGSLGTANQSPFGGKDFRSSRGFPGNYFFDIDNDGTDDVVIDPDCPADRTVSNFCVFDYAPFGFLIPAAERVGAMFMFDRDLGDFEIFGEFSVQHNTSEAGGAATPLDIDAGLTVSGTNPNNPFGEDLLINRHRTVDAGPRRWDIETDNLRMILGARGFVGAWDWEVALQRGRSESTQTGNKNQGWIRTDLLQIEIDAGRYNPFGGTVNPPSVIDAITTSLVRQGESHLTSFDGKLTGELFSMPAGPALAAFGFESREEDVSDVPDDQFQRGLIFGTESVSARASREYWAAYGEVSLPVTDEIEVQFALRHDDYDSFGSTTNPKLAASWQPRDDMRFRASWGEGFRAPSLAQVGLGPSQDSRFLLDTYCLPSVDVNNLCLNPTDPNVSTDYTIIFAGNPGLEAEESESWNVGLIWDVTESFNFSADIWSITQDGKIAENDVNVVYDAFCNPAALNPNFCTRDPNSNALISVNNSFFNLDSQEASGLDLSVNYNMDLSDMGSLSLAWNLAYIIDFERTEPNIDPNDPNAPPFKTRKLDGQYEYPEVRWTGSAKWIVEEWVAYASVSYIGEFEDTPEGTFDPADDVFRSVDAFVTVDVQVQYNTSDSSTYAIGVSNLFDEEPPFAVGDANRDLYGYVQGIHNPRGQFVYGRATYRF